MSTGYGWEGLRQVYAMLLGARHVPERLCGGLVYLGRYNKCSPLSFCLLPQPVAAIDYTMACTVLTTQNHGLIETNCNNGPQSRVHCTL